MEKEICICAAVKATNGLIFRGHRHADCFDMIVKRKMIILKAEDAQGFITSKNRFVDRKEGLRLQLEAGIKSHEKDDYINMYGLFSEDLY